MGQIIFITGDAASPKATMAVERFEEAERAEYLVTGEMSTSAFKYIIFLESSGIGEWHIRRNFEPLINTVDTDYCSYYILDNIPDYAAKLIENDRHIYGMESHTRFISESVKKLSEEIRDSGGNIIILSDDVQPSRSDDEDRKLLNSVISEVNRQIMTIADEILSFENGEIRRIK